jgi:hypothetical protein
MNRFKIFEEFEESKNIPYPEYVIIMDFIYRKIKDEIKPELPGSFELSYKRGDIIKLSTENKKDLIIEIALENEMLNISIKPQNNVEPEYEIGYDINKENADKIIDMIEKELIKNPVKKTNAKKESVKKSQKEDFDIIEFEFNDKDKSKQRKKFTTKKIDFNIIKQVLEDSFLLDEIKLAKNIDINDLLRRMLQEQRKTN